MHTTTSELAHPFLVRRGLEWLQQRGLAVPPGLELDVLVSPAGVTRHLQLDVLRRVGEDGGEAAVVSLSIPVFQGAEGQIMLPLRNAVTVTDLLEREHRLASYYPAHPKVRVLGESAQQVDLEATSTSGGPLERLEALAWFGLHLALFEAMAAVQVRGQLPASERPDALVYDRGAVHGPIPAGGHARWRVKWTRFDRKGDALAAQPVARVPALRGKAESVGAQVQAVVRDDPARRWTLADAGGALALSGRSLQRLLSSSGVRFSSLVDEVRIAEARRLLVGTTLTVAEVAYLSGFSDLGHLRRRFKELYRTTPSIWRANQT